MRPNKGFTLIELLLSAVLSGMVVMGLVYGFTAFAGRAAQEKATQRVQLEVALTTDWITHEIEEAAALPPVEEYIGLEDLPGPVVLALVLPKGNRYSLVLYSQGPLPGGFPYDDQGFKNRYSVLQGALYRWESTPAKDLESALASAIDPDQVELVTAYLLDPQGLVFTPNEDGRGGFLQVNGLAPRTLAGNPCSEGQSTACLPLTREIQVYARNLLPLEALDPLESPPI